jgi:hypothetical protein
MGESLGVFSKVSPYDFEIFGYEQILFLRNK